LPPAEGTTHEGEISVSIIEATPPTGRPLPAADSGYVKQNLCREIRTLIEHLRDEETGHTDVRLDVLALDVLDELDRVEGLDTLPRDVRYRLTGAAFALRDHAEAITRTTETIRRLAGTIASGWYDAGEPDV
jgi:hypothetical protein